MLSSLQEKFPDIAFVSTSRLEEYASDAAENLSFRPSIVALPSSTKEVSQLVAYCYKHQIPIFPRGAGTGLVGGSLAQKEGLMISLEKMNSIVEIDEENFTIQVEAGVINYHIQEALESRGLFYPPDPSSWQSCMIGGNIATNAGGPRAVKYGVTAHWVLNLQVVLPNGSIIWTGANTLKNATTYNLTQLFIGSEGTLGVVTQALLKVAPKPKWEQSMWVPFYQLNESAEAVSYLLRKGMHPSTLEFMEKNALKQMQKFSPEDVGMLEEKAEAYLLISYDGNDIQKIEKEMEATYEYLLDFELGEVQVASNEQEKARLWRSRRKLAEVIKANGFTIEEDTVVPTSRLPELVQFAHQLEKKYHIQLVCYGHAGDGNLHVRINHPQYKYSYNNPEVESIITELFMKVKEMGGTISAEHGIGLIQKKYVPLVISEENLDIQKSIKKAIDPKNIMNPGKIFLD